MQYVAAYTRDNRSIHRNNTINPNTLQRFWPGLALRRLQTAITESWIWLEREILIAPNPEQDRDWAYVTERGHDFLKNASPIEWSAAQALQREQLDPVLAQEIGPAFRRGDFTRAVGNAFLTVELRVRRLAGLNNPKIQSVDAMWQAFRAGGPLFVPTIEEKPTCEMFAGAMGRLRNPHLHASRDVNNVRDAIRFIQYADLLLTMAEDHATAVKAQRAGGGGQVQGATE